MNAVRPGDAGYPSRLLDLGKPPDPLWVSGELPPSTVPTVGIVGTRRLTQYGARVAREVAGRLATEGAAVVSGLAQGIDSTAHAAAIAVGGRTIAVLGEGLAAFDADGPLQRRKLAGLIRERGAVVSEYALDLRATTWSFPRRNATIAALSDVLIVIEAPLGSGALITAERALDLRRPVYVVPGPYGAPTWLGSARLMTHGRARVLVDAADIAAILHLEPAQPSTATDDPLLSLLATGPADADAIAAGLGVPFGDVPRLLADHLLAGTVVTTGDGRFARR